MTISDTDNQAMTTQPAIDFYGKMLTFSRLQLNTDDLTAIEAHLASMLSNKTSNIPVIIDSNIEQDLDALVELLWSWGLQPIGVVTGMLETQARAKRLAIFPADGKRIERILPSKKSATQLSQAAIDNTAEAQPDSNNEQGSHTDTTSATGQDSDTEASAPTEILSTDHITSMIYDQMLRSGQTINHVGGDLILTNSVNSGAEAITDNSLHVYGRAQGRLVAGATGDKDARIFCQVFNPSLVSVAGTYCLRDNLPAHVIDKPVQVRFIEGEGLVFTVIENT
ncbi:septum site-determining protein MinC [Psychrobacter sp. CAL346-MNA-CIBAN-0220]|uniref:septum site-determining protein MinC n=1 Tax=Psychrobacter sp. CAL346-MNA-CIBAN-0220 TaxID=3140457 RepID=UPI00331DC43D